MLDPKVGRARLSEDNGIVSIEIPSKTQIFGTFFVSFWMIGWAMGWFSAVGMLLSGAGLGSVFLLGWLGAWTVAGVAAGTFLLWNIAGTERITLGPTFILVSRQIPGWPRKTECAMATVSDLRTAPPVAMPVFNRNMPGIWANRSKGAVLFTYGVHTIGFGLELDTAEAQKMVAFLHNRFPQLAK